MSEHTIVCTGPDHDQRQGQPGWAAELGRVALPDRADPARALAGYLCGACAEARRQARGKKRTLPAREQVRALARALDAVLDGGQPSAEDREIVRELAAP